MRATGERTARCNSLNRRRLRRRERERRPSPPSPPSFPLLWRCFAGAYDFIPFCTVHQVEDDGVVFFLLIDFQQLKNLCGGANLLDALRENPKEALLCMGAAVHLAKCSGYESEEGCRSVDKVNIRLYNHTETIIALKNLKVAILVKI